MAVSAPLVMHVSSSSYHMLTRYGTLVALSAPLVMPLHDSDIQMNVPITFRNGQPMSRSPPGLSAVLALGLF